MPTTTFNVTIRGMSAKDLPALDATGSSDPFVKVNFDNFKTYSTGVKFKSLAPAWEEDVSFLYTTKYADCLSRKSVLFEVFDHNYFSSNELIGTCKVDLHTVATGCVRHELPIRDGRKTRGTLCVDIVMEQTASVEMRMVNAGLRTLPQAEGPLRALRSAQLACTVPAGPATGKVGVQTTASGVLPLDTLLGPNGFPHPDVLYAEGSLGAVCATSLTYTLSDAGGTPLAKGVLRIDEVYTFVEGEAVEFVAPLLPEPGSPLPPGVSVRGSLIYSSFPVFSQMEGGLHTEAGIKGAAYPFADIPFRPRVAVTDEGGKELEGSRLTSVMARVASSTRSLTAAGGGRGGASGAPGGPGSSGGRPTDALVKKPPPPTDDDLSKPRYKPGNPVGLLPPSVTERLFGGAPGLPLCWVRREATSGAVAFENLANAHMEVDLPKDAEYVVTLPAVDAPGPLGMQLEPNFSGAARYGFKSGRRNSGFDIGAVVRGLKPDSPLALAGKIRPGHHLIAINGASTLKLTFDATVAALRSAGRPLILRFHDPYAVHSDLAVQAKKANLSAKQSAGHARGSRSNYSGGGGPGGARGGPGAAKPGAPNPAATFSKKTTAEASRTLNLALDMLARADLLGGAAREGPGGDLTRTLEDAGFLRTLTAVITGTAGDAAPEAIRERLEEEARDAEEAGKKKAQAELEAEMSRGPGWSAGGGPGGRVEEEKKDEDEAYEEATPLSATARALTSDAAAAKALGAIANIAAASAATTRRVAELGVYTRSVAAVAARPAVEVATAALSAVNAAGPALAKSLGGSLHAGMKALSLGGPSLIILQAAARRHEYVPEMVERNNDTLSALALDNPDQDGAGFLHLVARGVAEMTALVRAGYARAQAPDGSAFYILPSGDSVWDPPPPLAAAFTTLKLLDRRARVIEDGAVVSAEGVSVTLPGVGGGPPTVLPLTTALPMCLEGVVEDAYASSVLLGAAARIASNPPNALALLQGGVIGASDAILAAHPTEPRVAEVFSTLQFNIGRDLDSSEALLLSGTVAKVTALARAYMRHKCTWTGSVSPFPPEGHEAEASEVIVLPGVDRNAREKNALRPRLVRTCINVLINLACYRRPVLIPAGVEGEGGVEASSVDLIVACGGVPLLGEVLLAHINESSVVTSVLNAAANIAFKNREVQLAIGESMTDAIVLSGWSFQRDSNLISMALRAIGNLTNEDLNIYRGLGYGVGRMIAAAMRNNATNVPLQTLAASVLSNIASVEPLADPAEAAEDVRLFEETVGVRGTHPALALRPSPEDALAVSALLSGGRSMWQVAPWLLVQEGAVACLTFAMTKYAQDVGLVEACLRTLLCVCNEEDVTAELVNKHDLVGRVLFVMRACDFDVSVQASGAAILAMAGGLTPCAATVAGSDAAHTVLMALDTHKGTLTTALAGAAHAVAHAGGGTPPPPPRPSSPAWSPSWRASPERC